MLGEDKVVFTLEFVVYQIGGIEKMKKPKKYFLKKGWLVQLLTLMIALALLVSVIPGVMSQQKENKISIQTTITFSDPVITPNSDNEQFIDITMDGAPSALHIPTEPLLPQLNKVIELPFGAQHIDVDFSVTSGIHTLSLEADVVSPSPIPVPLLLEEEPSPLISVLQKIALRKVSDGSLQREPADEITLLDESIYSSEAFYPEQPFSYEVGVGRNNQGDMATFVIARIVPLSYSPGTSTAQYFTQAVLDISYEQSDPLPEQGSEEFDLLILCADGYENTLGKLVDHKEDMGLATKLIPLENIYSERYFDLPEWCHDNQEQIKYFIYKAWETWNVSYILAVGGFRTFWGRDNPDVQFPIRYSHLDDDAEPGYACDQYYSCFLNEAYEFDDWDSNDNGIFGENDDTYDPHPDIFFGRLACRNNIEVRTMIRKIITYETETYGSDWFNKILTITGDGFGDLDNLGVPWDTTGLPAGEYTVYAQSCLQSDPFIMGPIDNVTFTIDHEQESLVNFHEWDHLLVEKLDEDQERLYPGKPVAHIVTPSPDNILGNTNVNYNPDEAYCSDYTGWGHVRYWDEVMYIKTKSYDPSPKDNLSHFGSFTTVTIWVEDSQGNTVYGPIDKNSKTYFEGEMECQKALDYMPEEFEQIDLWSSSGNWAGMWDVIDTMSEGQGFVYFAGHGNPMSWGDHLPGIPGGRGNGMINGLKCFSLDFGLARYETETGDPILPMDKLTNGNKLPVLLVGGCHNSAIDACFLRLFADPDEVLFTVLHGLWVSETWAWWLERVSRGGAIGTIGCSGLGYGYLGASCINGLGGWINPEFFRVYAEDERDVLGETFTQTITNYVDQIGWGVESDRKTFEEWMFLGDPSLKIGGYGASQSAEAGREQIVEIGDIVPNGSVITSTITNIGPTDLEDLEWEMQVVSDSPLGEYFGGTPFLLWLFKGRVMEQINEGLCSDLLVDETIDIASEPVFGIGHIKVKIYVYQDDALAAYKIEDGFVFLNKMILAHPEE